MKYSVLIAVCVAAMGFAAVAEQSDAPAKVEAPKAPAAVVAPVVVTTNAVTGVVTTNAVKVTEIKEIKKDAPKPMGQ